MDRDENSHSESESEVDISKHARLVEDVLNLSKNVSVKKPSRTEPTLQISEFSLVKSVAGNKGSVHVNDLTKVLKQRKKHVDIGKKVRSAGRKAKTLDKPLEKPQALRIRRSTAFEKVKNDLNRWEAIVTSNRASNNLNFPLKTDTEFNKNTDIWERWRLKSDLQKKLDELEPKVEVINVETDAKYPLTMKEIMEKRREAAKLRAVQSYKEAKARRQNKIKSKKFHRIQRREKIKQQMKDFELLQQTNPEEALKKLEEIEKARAEERVSLRHRSTGQWARSKQVRAKYDKESRQVLAQQLAISRDLTQKHKVDESSDSEQEENFKIKNQPQSDSNPWTNNAIKTSNEIDEFISGYRKFWDEKNKCNQEQNQIDVENNNESGSCPETADLAENKLHECQETYKTDDQTSSNENEAKINKNEVQNEVFDNVDDVSNSENQSEVNQIKPTSSKSTTPLKKRKKGGKCRKIQKLNASLSTTDWEVTLLDVNDPNISDEEIEKVFDDLNTKLNKQLQRKYSKIKTKINPRDKFKKKSKLKSKVNNSSYKVDLSLPLKTKRPVIDEELNENPNDAEGKPENNSEMLENLHRKSKSFDVLNSILSTTAQKLKQNNKNIDPNQLISVTPVNLSTEIPDLLTLDENEENVDQRGTISEAFEDDDIVDEFKKDKMDEIDKDTPKNIDLSLPGWGSWSGTGIAKSKHKRKSKRFIINFPKNIPRKDDNKGNLIINEKANQKIKSHLVSDLPFPFTSVKDFEASIRAPISNTFVPETAYRKMIKPVVRTRIGTIIQPMNESILLKKKK